MPFHSKAWISRRLHRLDAVNGRDDGQEAAGLSGILAGIILGMLLGSIGASGIIRDLLQRCAH